MNRLQKLIHRIENPIHVSNEDAFDTVKQYWDDVVSGYWQDTDEELAEELGVTPTALSELLEVHRHTFSYANIGGNSSVRGYDHGENWLVVMFSDGSRYLYTLKSTDRETLDYMRRLAMAGKGLNSYITRIVGPNYAGRNYKGTITIKPGMEHFNPEGYRRLLLLQAFRNTMTQSNTVGNEVIMHSTLKKYKQQITEAGVDGLDPVARQVLGVGLEAMGYGAKPSLESIDQSEAISESKALENIVDGALAGSMEGFWDSIKDFFAGRPTKIHLAGSDPGLRNKLDRTINDRTWLSRQKYTLGEVSYRAVPDFNPATASQQVSRYRSAVSMAVQHNSREMAKIKERLQAVNQCFMMYSSRDIFETSYITAVMADISPYAVRLNINIKEPEIVPQEMVTQTGEALTKVEVKKFAELIGQVFDSQLSFAKSISVTGGNAWASSLNFRYANKPGGAKVLAALRQLQAQYDQLILMINREIKQRVSTHSAWIVAENLADSMVNYIAKSITNVTVNSMEGYNVSNESILGAVRYLFGGNYEDRPKINAAYDEAVDAVHKTYGNPEWLKSRRLAKGNIKLKQYIDVAKNPAAALQKVKQLNANALAQNKGVFKKEMEYLGKYIKFLQSADRANEQKAQALLDMFDEDFDDRFGESDDYTGGGGGEVAALDADGMLATAKIFEEAIKYRLETDQFYSSGFWKMITTDSGAQRYGDEGKDTARLEGPSKELAEKIGERIENMQEDYYSYVMLDWGNVNAVVQGCLALMNESAN